MPALKVTAPAKTILFGEHAVVYGHPAIAIPVNQLKTTITIQPNPWGASNQITIHAPDIGLSTALEELPNQHPFSTAFSVVMQHLGMTTYPACTVKINSTIPIASGLGSSASLSVALIKAFSQFAGADLPSQTLIDLSFQLETIYHGTPSGIDNSVIALNQGILFQKGKPVQALNSAKPLPIVIANSGVAGNTKQAVAGVRESWQHNKPYFDALFQKIGSTTWEALQALENGDEIRLGQLMNSNHRDLQTLRVSHPKIDRLVETALKHDALGAKLCGGGLGGNMICLIHAEQAGEIQKALMQAGAAQTYLTQVESREI